MTLPLQESLTPVPPAMSLRTQPVRYEQSLVVSAPFVTVNATDTTPYCDGKMSRGTSPRLRAFTFAKSPCLITPVFTAPPAGAALFTYLAIVLSFTTQLA